MTSTFVAPTLVAAATVSVFGAVALRSRPVLDSIVTVRGRDRRSVLDALGRSKIVRAAVGAPRLEGLVAAAGSTTAGVDRVAGAAAATGALVAAVALALGGVASLLAPVALVTALRAPTFVAARAARRRLRSVERDVPLLLDVLSLASFAGLPPPAALRRAVSAIDGPLAVELSDALQDVELGARWRDRLARLADDVPIPDLRRTIAVLLRTESIGASTAEPITILADEVRAARRAAAAERARKAPVQMLFPLVFLVLPAFLLLTVVPVLVATLGSIR